MAKYFTAIFFDADGNAYKYRNIRNTEHSLRKFIQFARNKNAVEINFYDKKTREFIHKERL